MTPPKRKKKQERFAMKKTPKSKKHTGCAYGSFEDEITRRAIKILKAERAVIKAAQKWFERPLYSDEMSRLSTAVFRLNKLKESK